MNLVVLEGAVIRDPDHRTLATGEQVTSFDLAVSTDSGPPESVPVSWIDPDPRLNLVAGLDLVVVGRVRRRFFRVGGATQSRTEVVVAELVPVRQRAKARSAVSQAVDTLTERAS